MNSTNIFIFLCRTTTYIQKIRVFNLYIWLFLWTETFLSVSSCNYTQPQETN